MKYTEKQYRLMERLSPGILFDEMTDGERAILAFLDRENLAEPRAYQKDGLWFLSQNGEAELGRYHSELASMEQVAHDKADSKKQKRFENKIAVLNLLVPFVTFILGLLAEHYVGIITTILGFFQTIG